MRSASGRADRAPRPDRHAGEIKLEGEVVGVVEIWLGRQEEAAPEPGRDVRRRRLPMLAAMRGGDGAPTLAAMRGDDAGCEEARAEASDGAAASHAGRDGEESRAEASDACCDGEERGRVRGWPERGGAGRDGGKEPPAPTLCAGWDGGSTEKGEDGWVIGSWDGVEAGLHGEEPAGTGEGSAGPPAPTPCAGWDGARTEKEWRIWVVGGGVGLVRFIFHFPFLFFII
jgi:hypothetical protein